MNESDSEEWSWLWVTMCHQYHQCNHDCHHTRKKMKPIIRVGLWDKENRTNENREEEENREKEDGKQRVHKSSNGKGVQPWWFSKLMIFWVEFHLSAFWLIITSIDSSLPLSSFLSQFSRILETYAWTSEWVQQIDGRVNERKGKERNRKRSNEMEEERNEREKWQTKEKEKERVGKVNEKIEPRKDSFRKSWVNSIF